LLNTAQDAPESGFVWSKCVDDSTEIRRRTVSFSAQYRRCAVE
jgi:hypothetical protein